MQFWKDFAPKQLGGLTVHPKPSPATFSSNLHHSCINPSIYFNFFYHCEQILQNSSDFQEENFSSQVKVNVAIEFQSIFPNLAINPKESNVNLTISHTTS